METVYANSTKILGPVTSSIIGKEIKREKKREGRRVSKEENWQRKLDIQGISDAEHAVCSSGKEKKRDTRNERWWWKNKWPPGGQ